MRPSPLPALILAAVPLVLTLMAARPSLQDAAVATYRNPVVSGDFADPSVIRVGDTYYAAGTSSEWAPYYPLLISRDLVNWRQLGHVFTRMPEWAVSSYWAPELFHQNGTFFTYFTARRKTDNVSVIGVATTDDPRRGFVDRGIIVETGKEAIDGFPFLDDDGRLYLSWKAYGLPDDGRPTTLLASEMTPDGLTLRGAPFVLLEGGYEGEAIVKRDGWYYLFYSSKSCCGRTCDYQLEVARAKAIRGPWLLHAAGNPILRGGGEWRCPGHGTPVRAPDGRWFYLYHAYHARDFVHVGRQGLLDELLWSNEGWPFFKYGRVPTTQAPTPFGNDAGLGPRDFADDFAESARPLPWQWDFRHPPSITTRDGVLHVTVTESAAASPSGAFYGVAPAQGTYTVTTMVDPRGVALKGLAAYGDAGNALGLGVSDGRLVLWTVEKRQRRTLVEQPLSVAAAVSLRMEVRNAGRYRFAWSADGRSWTPVARDGDERRDVDGDGLPPWDRGVRAGLFVTGEKGATGSFRNFRISYAH